MAAKFNPLEAEDLKIHVVACGERYLAFNNSLVRVNSRLERIENMIRRGTWFLLIGLGGLLFEALLWERLAGALAVQP